MTDKALQEYEQQALDLFARARIYVKKKAPYFSKMVHTLVPLPIPNLSKVSAGAIGVTTDLLLVYDPIRIVDDPEFNALNSDKLPEKLGGVLAHEIMHILRDMGRIEPLHQINPLIANLAADLPINTDLRKAGWALPSFAVYPEKYDLPEGESLEWYFKKLMENAEKVTQDTQVGVTAGSCGSAAGNFPEDAEAKIQEATQDYADKHPGKELGRQQAEAINAKRATARAAQEHYAGYGQAECPPWVEQNLKADRARPERNWEKELAYVTRRTTGLMRTGGSDFSLARPSKRSFLSDFPRPGLIDQEVSVALAWDTSGSMGAEQLQKCQEVSLDILRQLGIDQVQIAQFDQAITAEFTRVSLRDVPRIDVRGRRGTDFRPLFQAAQALRPRPDVLLVLTDGDGPAPSRPPPTIATIWVIVPSYYTRIPAPWGRAVICSNDQTVVDALT